MAMNGSTINKGSIEAIAIWFDNANSFLILARACEIQFKIIWLYLIIEEANREHKWI